MRAFIPFAVIALIAAAVGPCSAAEPPPGGIFISGAAVIDVRTGKVQASDILVRDGRIVAVTKKGARRAPADAQVVDATGRYAIPGLWDMHLHLAAVPEMDADRVLTLLLVNGVTSVRDTGGPLEKVLAIRKRANEETAAAPRVRIAGPIIDG